MKIPYGENAEGYMIHISDVGSGSHTGCFCPECKTPLVAYKGKIKQEHFGHRADYSCKGALETGLHKFAKQVLRESREVLLPEQIARYGQTRRTISMEKIFRYESVDEEVIMPDMTPDIVVKRDQFELFIEIAVTHFCDDEKLELLRQRRWAAIEIDLSKVPRNASPAYHKRAVLRGAPRRWLFNGRIEEAKSELHQQEVDRASAAQRYLDSKWGALASDLTAAYQADSELFEDHWIEDITDAGLQEYIGIPIQGSGCFRHSQVWQSAIVGRFVLRSTILQPSQVIAWFHENAFLKPAFKSIKSDGQSEMKRYLATSVPGFRLPIEVVTDYVVKLENFGLLNREFKWWISDTTKAQNARKSIDLIRAAIARWEAVEEVLEEIKKNAIRGSAIDTEKWALIPHDGLKNTPDQIIRSGGYESDKLLEQLRDLRRMLKEGEYPTRYCLIGLPLEEEHECRLREQEETVERHRLEKERRQKIEEDLKRSETSIFLSQLRSDAQLAFGVEAGDGWLSSKLPDGLSDNDGLILDYEQQRSLQSALYAERSRLREIENTENEKAEITSRCRSELSLKAQQDPLLMSPERVDVWLRTTQIWANGVKSKPYDFCVDKATLSECLARLPSNFNKASKKKRK